MLINKDIVIDIAKKTKCPILEMFWINDSNKWYVCFEEYIVIKGENQTVHIDDVLKEIEKYDNVENIVNEIYIGDEPNSYFEQVTFEWKKPKEKINNLCENCKYHETYWNIFDAHDKTDYCQIHQTEFANINNADIRYCDNFELWVIK